MIVDAFADSKAYEYHGGIMDSNPNVWGHLCHSTVSFASEFYA
jgi:hypothetical protein